MREPMPETNAEVFGPSGGVCNSDQPVLWIPAGRFPPFLNWQISTGDHYWRSLSGDVAAAIDAMQYP